MTAYLGFDTSNYTTSTALYTSEGEFSKRKLLEVKPGELGLRQSEALFQHTRNIPLLIDELLCGFTDEINAVGVSDRPRDIEGSYMPCFLAGVSASSAVAAAMKLPLYRFSHQAGHIAAVALGSGRYDLVGTEFIAFHISGGTTEAVLVTPDKERVFNCKIISQSLDLKAGQAIDRVGVMLGLPFPAGPKLDEIALKGTPKKGLRASVKDGNCCLSGIENICKQMRDKGEEPENIAATCIEYIRISVSQMLEGLLSAYGDLPVVFSGGVSANSSLRKDFTERYDAVFGPKHLSGDNAVGIAYLASLRHSEVI